MCWGICTARTFPRRSSPSACSFTTGGWLLPACGACRWPLDCCSAAGEWPPELRTDEKKAAVRVSDGIQEALENVREIRATNQEERYLEGLNRKIDDHEKVMIKGELSTGLFVNAASVIMRLGVATTILVGRSLILSGRSILCFVPVPFGHHPHLCALRPEPGPDCGDVRLPGVGRPHE